MKGLKKESTHCSECGVEWLADKSNKVAKRAICHQCFPIVTQKYYQRYHKREEVPRYIKYADYKIENRRADNRALSKKMMGYQKREEWQEAIRLRFEEIRNDTGLWDFICRDMEIYKKRVKGKKTIKQLTIDNYDEQI